MPRASVRSGGGSTALGSHSSVRCRMTARTLPRGLFVGSRVEKRRAVLLPRRASKHPNSGTVDVPGPPLPYGLHSCFVPNEELVGAG